jgi:hypothetical protein
MTFLFSPVEVVVAEIYIDTLKLLLTESEPPILNGQKDLVKARRGRGRLIGHIHHIFIVGCDTRVIEPIWRTLS